MAQVELRNHVTLKNRGLKVKWWNWLVFAAALEVFVPRRRKKVEWWDWLVFAAVVSSAFL